MERVLFVLRHAEATPAASYTGDFARNLTPRGVKQAQDAAQWLRQQIPQPTYALVSAAQRTRETFSIVKGELAVATLDVTPALYEAELGRCVQLLQSLPDEHGAALIVAHNPGLQELVNLLADADPRGMRVNMGTGTCVRLAASLAWRDWTPGCAAVVGTFPAA